MRSGHTIEFVTPMPTFVRVLSYNENTTTFLFSIYAKKEKEVRGENIYMAQGNKDSSFTTPTLSGKNGQKKTKVKTEFNSFESSNPPVPSPATSTKPEKTLSLVRKMFAVLRHPDTTPSTELPDGQLCGPYATRYILAGHHNRSNKKEHT
jgi:hypothetical protein